MFQHQLTPYRYCFLYTLLIVPLSVLAAGCAQHETEQTRAGTFEGPPVAIGEGDARTFVVLDEQGQVRTLGISMSETALQGLPQSAAHGEIEYPLALPPEAAVSGYDHVTVDWNPQGHEPPGVYDLPHFDFHFYVIDRGSRESITAVGDDLARAHKALAPGQMPKDYVLPEGTEVPRMGAHAIDPGSDEFNGKPFTQTFIYGFYDGKVIFMEPMITLVFLQSDPNVSIPVKQPQVYEPGFAYPGAYGTRYNAQQRRYMITLDDLRSH